ncbi:hypothetical protein SPRG_04836 [Saprolegnia parasitica CBS 223.65]|uniref:EGF-like domain-containing protein n=1 Tax=Saprolegnia parasitica (strain CBS 223.65) TaxID=695850 RepID=A0A067CT79_SAPPC|nr:hypothetical protein SPRG_04836 [Saprolegnia parasitica CBS 223.65]KDO29721.1 hypothetical protein SPRG_04836 [Saprolegnia parasitica CBS 223.65]|eukprot:XP_012199371.1 hypothetical protein SPRG_04836 [Saprolegnia parasitica CBS 223.65]
MDLHTLLLALLWFSQINADIPRTPIPTSMLNDSWRHDLPEDTTVDVYESLPDAMAAVTASISLNETTWPDGQFVSGSILVLPGGLGTLNETAAPRTQVSYNYSISKTVWNLDADSNAISLVNCVYAANGSAVDLVVQSVENVTPYGPGQILLVSSRWGCVNAHGVLAAQAQLHVLEMVVLADERVLRLVVSPAALNASFATMSMHYRSNQFDLNETATASVAAGTSRRLDTVTHTFFSYVPNYKCTTGCGAYDLSDSQCFQYVSDEYLIWSCPGSQYWMYTKSLTTKACGLIHNCALPSGLKYNPVRECTTVCGAYGLAADQCFQFDSTRRISSGDCPGSLYFMCNVDSTWKDCGYKRGCIPSIGRTMTYNMVNGAVDKTDIELYRSAGCGTGNFLNAPSGSGCVRVGCANCAYTFTVNEIQISLDYDVSLSSAWVAGSATLYGSGFASAGFSLYAPDGVTWKRTVSLVDISLTYPALNLLGFDVEFTLEYALEETYTATMTTSATPFVMSKSVTLSNLVATAAYDSRSGKSQQTSVDVATTTQAPQRGEYVAFNFIYDQRTTVGLYASAAGLTLGVDVAWSDFVQLFCKGGVLPALASTAVVPSTPESLTFGNCAVPHLLELAIFSGRRDVVVTGYFSFEYSPLDFDYNWPVSIPSLSTNVSRFSFCYAPPYTLTLTITLNPSDANTLSLSTTLQAQLLAAMGQALGLPAFTANLFALKSISTTTGAVALTVMTPVAVSDVYPSFSALATYINARAETDEYKHAVNKALNLGCSPGYWGSVCQFRCSPPLQCAPDSVCTCDQSSGVVRTCRSCVDGQWGNVCQYTCTGYSNCDPTSLITCDSSSGAITCAKCNPGYCGSDCQYSCTAPSTCAGGSRDAVTCSQSTCAAVSCQQCNTGYYGNQCQYACTPPAACVSSGRTACAQSSGVASTCSACKTGYWGSICQSPCTVPATCDSSSNVTCTQSTGAAVTCGQCNPGYYGSACQYSCTAPAECSSSGQITCAQSNGVASTCSACKTGYWGSACQSSCIAPATCTSGDTVTCDQSTGAAVACGECSPGYYGSACQWSCVAPATCSFGDTVTCHQSTGAAVACGECSPGYYGSACQYSCSRPTTCTSNGTLSCDQYSGTVAMRYHEHCDVRRRRRLPRRMLFLRHWLLGISVPKRLHASLDVRFKR